MALCGVQAVRQRPAAAAQQLIEPDPAIATLSSLYGGLGLGRSLARGVLIRELDGRRVTAPYPLSAGIFSMTDDRLKFPEQVLKPPVEAVAALPSRDRFAASLRGFGPLGILAILIILAGNSVIVPLSAVLVLVWARWSRTPWREIGFARPRNWIITLAVGLAFGCALKFLMKAIVMPLLGADPINRAYHYLAGNRAAIPAALFAMVVGAGFGEETLFRGYMF
ncbi:MAG TPA: CPBP family intramembrane glutamic endopeptidase, partial [Pyrinomonadaceae bacterium]|nr:CPBP family intramembrane glutamic endopeptidase [Pyrinomonadaceae bacterium]